MSYTELIVFLVYLVFMVGIGVFFFLRTRSGGEKDYFLGGRKMGPWVSALSAGNRQKQSGRQPVFFSVGKCLSCDQ